MGLFLLWLLFGIGVVIQVVYLLIIFGRTAFCAGKSTNTSLETTSEGVTVMIAAHNEFRNLKVLIPKLFEQDYPLGTNK